MRTSFIYLLFITLIAVSLSSCVSTIRTTPSNVVVVKRLPVHHRIVYIKGLRYYNWENNYYRKTRRGYVIVRF